MTTNETSEPIGDDVLIHTARVNLDTRSRFYDERQPIECTIFANVPNDDLRGALYREGVREYGRCIGKAYMDTKSRGTIHTGYVFLKREPYSDDPDDTYLAETWVSVERVIEEARPTVVESVAL